MKSGKLRERLEHQTATEVLDSFGDTQATWSTVATYWAEVRPLSGREAVNANQLRADVSHAITIRAGVGAISTKDRFKLGSRIFHIGQVLDVDERGKTLSILAMEVV